MGALEQVRDSARASGQWWTGQDAIPLRETHLFLLGDYSATRDTQEMVQRLKLAGVTAVAYPKNPAYPNLYYFVGQVLGLPVEHPSGTSTLASTTVDTIEQLVPVPMALVQKRPWAQAVSPELIEAIKQVAADRTANQNKLSVYPEQETILPDTWVLLRAYGNIKTEVLGKLVRDAGYRSYVPDAGATGMFVSAADWKGDGWTEILINVGSSEVTPADLRQALSLDLGVYTTDILSGSAMQAGVEALAKAQEILRNTGEGISGTFDLLAELSRIFAGVKKHAKTIVWVAVGLLGVYVAVKVFGPAVARTAREYRGKRGRA